MRISPGKLWGLRRLSDESGRFKMLAIDQTGPIVNPIRQIRGLEAAPYDDIAAVKQLLARYLAPRASAVLLDPPLGYASSIEEISPRKGLILACEWATWQVTDTGRMSYNVPGWDAGTVRRIGADALKINLWFRADVGPEVRAHQVDYLNSVKQACSHHDIPLVLEFLTYPFPDETESDMVRGRTDRVLAALSDVDVMDPHGVDVYKLEAPISMTSVPDPDGPRASEVQRAFDRMAQGIKRPWVLLSAGAGPDDFHRALVYAYRAGASGYLAGRAIWADAFLRFPDLAAMEAALGSTSLAVMDRINELTDRLAVPWFKHVVWSDGVEVAPKGAEFAPLYAEACMRSG